MMLKVILICVLAATANICIKEYLPQYSSAFSALVCTLVAAACINAISPVAQYLASISQISSFRTYGEVMLKSCAIGLISKTASELCRDAGENALAGKAELAGKSALLLCALPLIKSLFLEVERFLL